MGGRRLCDGASRFSPMEGVWGSAPAQPAPYPPAAPQPSPRKEKEARGRQAGPGSRGPPRGSLQSESSSSSEAEAPYPCPEIQRLREAAGIALCQDKQPPAPRHCEANHKGERRVPWGSLPPCFGGLRACLHPTPLLGHRVL